LYQSTQFFLQVLVERDKQYSREKSRELKCYGRVRVQLKQENGAPFNPNFPTSKLIEQSAMSLFTEI